MPWPAATEDIPHLGRSTGQTLNDDETFVVIPVAGLTIIDAGTASSSPFQRSQKNVHVHLESAFTMRWKS